MLKLRSRFRRMLLVRGADRGQGATEYILLIGCVVLVLIVALLVYRDAVGRYVSRVGAWISGEESPPASSPAKPPPARAPEPVPPPPSTTGDPPPVDASLDWLIGTWCAPTPHMTIRRSPGGEVIMQIPTGHLPCSMDIGLYRIESIGPGEARVLGADGKTLAVFTRDSSGNLVWPGCPTFTNCTKG